MPFNSFGTLEFLGFRSPAMDEIMRIPLQFVPDDGLVETDFELLFRGDFATIFTRNRLRLVAGSAPLSATIKRVRIDQLTQLDARFRNELLLSQTCKHPNIITFYEGYGEPLTEDGTKFTHYCWISEQMEPLEKYYESQRQRDGHGFAVRDISLLCELMTQPLRALDYLNSFGVFGLNLSPRSISIKESNGSFLVKTSDFGLINDEIYYSTTDLNALIYKAREVLEGKSVSHRADVWAIGTIAIEFLGVKLFMPTGSEEEIAEKIAQNGPAKVVLERIEEVLTNFDQVSIECENRVEGDCGEINIPNFTKLMKAMLEQRPEDRSTAQSCLADLFLQKSNEQCEKRELPRDNETKLQKIQKEIFAEIEAFSGLRILESDSRVTRPTWNAAALARLSHDESPVSEDDSLTPPVIDFTWH